MTGSADLLNDFLTVGRNTRAHVTARWATLGAGAVCALIALLDAGAGGLTAAAVATLVVVGFFWSGMIPLFAVRGRDKSMAVGLGVLLLTYTTRLVLVLAVLVLGRQWEFLSASWASVTIIACAVVWIAVHLTATIRGRRPGKRG